MHANTAKYDVRGTQSICTELRYVHTYICMYYSLCMYCLLRMRGVWAVRKIAYIRNFVPRDNRELIRHQTGYDVILLAVGEHVRLSFIFPISSKSGMLT
jgi:hypothetical protein